MLLREFGLDPERDEAKRVLVELEIKGQPSRWNILRALRVLKWYSQNRTNQ
jgi:hypothetical protein